MDHSFSLTIVTPEATVFDGKAVSLIAPCALGYLGVLAHHAPMVAKVVKGKITVKKGPRDEEIIQSKGGGFLEVMENNVTILLDTA